MCVFVRACVRTCVRMRARVCVCVCEGEGKSVCYICVLLRLGTYGCVKACEILGKVCQIYIYIYR